MIKQMSVNTSCKSAAYCIGLTKSEKQDVAARHILFFIWLIQLQFRASA